MLGRDSGNQVVPCQVLDQPNAHALRREVRAAPDCRADAARDTCIEGERGEIRHRAVEADVLDAARDLRLCGLAELEFVEDVACYTPVAVRAEQAVDGAAV